MKKLLAISVKIFVIFCALCLCCCSSIQTRNFENKQPKLILEEYFAKDLSARGAFFDRSGDISTRMTVKTSGSWDGKALTLKEDLKYESGEIHHRTFLITKMDTHNYEVRCDEIVGVGKIESYGNALRWSYTLKEESKQAGGIKLDFDDWMYLAEDGQIIDRAVASKFGLKVGDVFLTMGPDNSNSK